MLLQSFPRVARRTAGTGRHNAARSGAERSGNLAKSLPAFWHQPLILLTGTAENFTPSAGSGTHPGEVSHQTYRHSFWPSEVKYHPVVAPSTCMNSTALSFMEVLSRCYWNATYAVEMLFLVSSYKPSCQGEKKSRTLPSFLLRETSWEMVPYARI